MCLRFPLPSFAHAFRFLRLAVMSVALALSIATPIDARPVTPRGPLTPEERLTIDIFDQAKRSVVYISTLQQVRDLWSRNVRSIPRGTGSGIIWDDQGHVITNYHVISGASAAKVRLSDGRDYPANLVGASAFHDIAVLRIEVPSNPPPPPACAEHGSSATDRSSRAISSCRWAASP